MKRIIHFQRTLLIGMSLLLNCGAGKCADAPKRILFFSKSSGYEDEMVRRVGGQRSPAENVLAEMGKENHLEFVFTKDGAVFTRENIAKFDAFCFFTSGDLTQAGDDHNPPMTKDGKAAFLQAVHDGKGFVGIHSAADTFRADTPDLDPYIKMIGGEFLNHNAPAAARQIVADKAFPGMASVPDNFTMVEDWYVLDHFSTNLHVLLVQDASSVGRAAYNIPNYPSTWVQMHGSGRVFYTSMGHGPEVWGNPVFRQILVGALKWVVKDVNADVLPNMDKVSPQARGK